MRLRNLNDLVRGELSGEARWVYRQAQTQIKERLTDVRSKLETVCRLSLEGRLNRTILEDTDIVLPALYKQLADQVTGTKVQILFVRKIIVRTESNSFDSVITSWLAGDSLDGWKLVYKDKKAVHKAVAATFQQVLATRVSDLTQSASESTEEEKVWAEDKKEDEEERLRDQVIAKVH